LFPDKLITAGKKKQTLSREISSSNYRISQLRLGLRSNKITIDKLGLEIKSLDGNIKNTHEEIAFKNEAIHKILRELQIKDDESLLVAFLKNQSLADSLKEIQNLAEFRRALAVDIKELQGLKTNLDDELGQVARNKQGIEQEYRNSTARKSIIEDQRVENRELLALTKNQEQLYEELIDELAERQAQIAAEVEKLEAELRKQINTDLLPSPRPGVLAWPIEDAYKKKPTQEYGRTPFAINGYKGQWHNGLDLGYPIGTPVLAAGAGVILSSGDQDRYCRKGAYGKYVVVRHGNNLVTLYAHMSNLAVSPGDQIERGEVIGYVGSTGYSTGPHLHFTVYDANTFKMRRSRVCGPMPSGGDIDPTQYL